MQRKHLNLIAAAIVIALGAGGAIWYYARPHSPSEQLELAQRIEAKNAGEISALKTTNSPEDRKKIAELLQQTVSEYAKVREKYPQATTDVQQADYRVLQLRDENTSGAEERIRLTEEFLKKYPNPPEAVDLRWRIAELTHKELKRYLDAIRLYQQFARDFPKEERAAEAEFRVATIYEEIKEFGRAVEGYQNVVKNYPSSKFAAEAQYRSANLLAEKMEKKKEAEAAYAKVEKEYPKSRFAAAAGGERKRLSSAAAKSESEEYGEKYYGGVREQDTLSRIAEELKLPQMQKLRAQDLDLLHQDITAEIAPSDHQLTVTTRLRLKAGAETTQPIVFQFPAPMKILGIKRGDQPLTAFSQQGGFLFFDLGSAPMRAGATEEFELHYTGINSDTWSGDIISSASSYAMGPNWLPVLKFEDNFTADISVTVPEGYYAMSQGELLATDVASSHTTFRYSMKVPAFFYTVAAAPYAVREAEYRSAVTGQAIKIYVCLFKEHAAEYFEGYLKELPSILEFYEGKLGAYPYPKIAVAEVKFFPGGRGTPGLILVGEKAFEKNGAPVEFLAHEAAHTWFGNLISINMIGDSIPWLSEGFANYWDALYLEHKQGRAALVQHLRTLANNYYQAVSQLTDRPIATTLWDNPMYVSLAYDKGTFVLHALRWLLGDDKFFAMMRKYVDDYRGKLTTLGDFAEAAEAAYGESLDWFAEEWLKRAGIPRYRLNQALELPEAGGKHETRIEIEQVGDKFRMPMEIELETKSGKQRIRLEVRESFTTTTLASDSEPVKVTLDPDYWILKHPRAEEWERPVTK